MLTAALALLAAAGEAPHIETATQMPSDGYRVEVLADDLDTPWNLSWLPSGDMLVTERGGRLRIIRDGELLDAPVAGLPDIHVRSQSGLFEAEPHPDFATNNLLYLTYASGTQRSNTLVLARATYVPTDDGAALENLEVLFEAQPYRSTSAHYGGRIVWGADDTLFLTSGDGYRYMKDAQKLDNHFGKVLRLTHDGKAPADNPFVGQDDAAPEVWSYGHRNPQGIAWGPGGTLYTNEHGPRGGDELNLMEAGVNYGWPVISYGIDYSGAQITPFKVMDGMQQPQFHWTPSIAPSTLVYYEGDAFPGLQGKMLTGSLAFKHVRVSDPADPAAPQQEMLKERDARVRDIAVGPDGALYVTTEVRRSDTGGEVLRILPEE